MTYYAEVNDDVRAALLNALHHKRISQAELARRIGVPRQNISRAITGGDPAGKIPAIWSKMLAEVGLKIVAVEDDTASAGAKDEA